MNKSSISITITGGEARIGNVVQGEYIDNSDRRVYNKEVGNLFNQAVDKINLLASEGNKGSSEIIIIRDQLNALKCDMLASPPKDKKSLGKTAKDIYDDYAWAAKPLKDLFESLGLFA